MAASLDDSGFWLPTHFLADDEKLKHLDNDAGLCFPTEFPYEVESPVESVVSSTETYSSDDDDFFTGLTRRLAQSSFHETQRLGVPCFKSQEPKKQAVSSGSPQSTLSGIGSWSGRSGGSSNGSPNGTSQVSSPPATPFRFSNDTWELIYAAAGEVARLKMNGEVALLSHQQGRGPMGPPSNHNTSFYSHQTVNRCLPHANQEQAVKQPCTAVWGRQVKTPWPTQNQDHHAYTQNSSRNFVHQELGFGPCLSHRHQVHRQHQNLQPQTPRNGLGTRPAFLNSAAGKRESAGTGVFLPRRYSNPSDSRKKPGCSPVLVPAKVVQALNLNFNDVNGTAVLRSGGGVAPDHEALIARRNALLMHQRRSMNPLQGSTEGHLSHEARLPQEWTY